ncbi:MAG: ABC transporter permease [Planctomycetota bacterium]|jgi:putative ABC transport system permease protein
MLLTPFGDWLKSLGEQRGRTLSTLMGVGWGTFAVVAMLAFGAGLEGMMQERAAGMGQGVVVTWINRTTLPWRGFPEGRQLLATDEDILALREMVPGIDDVSPEYVRNEQVQIGQSVFRTKLNGVFPSYGKMRSMWVQPGGRFLNTEDQTAGRKVMFLGDRIKQQMFGEADAIGKQVVVAGSPFVVIGVLAPKPQDSDYGGKDESRICIPASTYRRLFGDRYVDNFIYRAEDRGRTQEVVDGVYAALGQRLGFDPSDRDALNTWDTTEGDRIRSTIFDAMAILSAFAGTLTLLVGGLGVGNLMFVLVKRRTREIGIQLALGALPRWILLEVLLQTMFLITAGGLLGFLGAWGLTSLIALTPLTSALGYPQVSPAVAVGTIGLLSLVGLAAGIYPARRAAGLDPVEALND